MSALNPRRTVAELKDLRTLTGDENGAQRVAFTKTWLAAREWLRKRVAELPLEIHDDAAGNTWFTLAGASDQCLLIGGHMDSVPNGGWLDGSLNVLAGVEILRRIHAQYGGKPPVTVRLVDWADEEGARFGKSLFGSSACSGNLNLDEARQLKDKHGIALPDAMREAGIDFERVKESRVELENTAAYIELHIEQGPVLLDMDLPLAVVLGTFGVERHAITFHGQAAHAGATPMNRRKDAFLAAAKMSPEIYRIAERSGNGVCTIGSCMTKPGFVTSVVEDCRITLDQRHLDIAALETMLLDARIASEKFAAEGDVTVSWERLWNIEPRPFHNELITLCDEAIRETCGKSHRMPSGPLHDAAEVAAAGIPTVMMFVQSLHGISHNKIEDTKEEHLELAVTAFDKLAEKAMGWIKAKEVNGKNPGLNWFAILMTAMLVGLMAGCASTPEDPRNEPSPALEKQALSFKPPPGKAGVYIICPYYFLGWQAEWDFCLDRQKPISLKTSSFSYTPVWPGEYTISDPNDEIGDNVTFVANEGQNCFISDGKSGYKLLSEETGKTYVRQYRMNGDSFYQLPFMPEAADSLAPAACHIVLAQQDPFVAADIVLPPNLEGTNPNFVVSGGGTSAKAVAGDIGESVGLEIGGLLLMSVVDSLANKHEIAKSDKMGRALQGHGLNDSFSTNFLNSLTAGLNESPWLHATSIDTTHEKGNMMPSDTSQHPVVQVNLVYFLSPDASSLIIKAHLLYFRKGETNATYSRFYTYFSESLSAQNKRAIAQWSASNDELLHQRMDEGISELIKMIDMDFFHRKLMDPNKRSVTIARSPLVRFRGFVLANEGQRIIVQSESGNIISTIGSVVPNPKQGSFYYLYSPPPGHSIY